MSDASDSALVLFPGALGDFICFLPALSGLRQRHRGRMLLVAKPALLELVRFPDTTGVSIDRREIADLFATATCIAPGTATLLNGFTHVYSWTGFNDPDFAKRVAAVTGAWINVYRFRGIQAGEHAVDYYTRCAGIIGTRPVAHAFVEDAAWLVAFEREHQLHGRTIVLMHPGSGARLKNWQGFAAVGCHWREHHGAAVVVLQGPAEVGRSADTGAEAIVLNGLSLPQVVALLRRSRLYLGNDSGISHLAGAVGACGVAVFGPTDPAVWAPRSERVRILHAPEPCVRCGAGVFCVHSLAVERVIESMEFQSRHFANTITYNGSCNRPSTGSGK